MVSPQGDVAGMVKAPLLQQRDEKYGLSSTKISDLRVDISGPALINPNADYWLRHGKGFAIDVITAEMKKITQFP